MKQRRIKELTINHYEQGSSVSYTPSRTEEYAPVLAQAEAHQDLRFHAEIEGTETLIILPWESVIRVDGGYETADVAAPYDAICGGCATPGASLKLKDGVTTCLTSELDPETGDTEITYNFTKDGDTVTVSGGTDAVYMEASDAAKFFDYSTDCEEAELSEKIWLHPGMVDYDNWTVYVGIGDASEIEADIDYIENAVMNFNTERCE